MFCIEFGEKNTNKDRHSRLKVKSYLFPPPTLESGERGTTEGQQKNIIYNNITFKFEYNVITLCARACRRLHNRETNRTYNAYYIIILYCVDMLFFIVYTQ